MGWISQWFWSKMQKRQNSKIELTQNNDYVRDLFRCCTSRPRKSTFKNHHNRSLQRRKQLRPNNRSTTLKALPALMLWIITAKPNCDLFIIIVVYFTTWSLSHYSCRSTFSYSLLTFSFYCVNVELVGVKADELTGAGQHSSYFGNAWLEVSNFKSQYLCLHLYSVTTLYTDVLNTNEHSTVYYVTSYAIHGDSMYM